MSNLPKRRDRAAKTTSPNHLTTGRYHATTPPAGGLRATADLGLVFLFFIRGSYEEIPDESCPKRPQLVLLFFVEVPNEENPDDRRSTAAHNPSGAFATYPEPHTTSRRITRSLVSQGISVRSRSNSLGPTSLAAARQQQLLRLDRGMQGRNAKGKVLPAAIGPPGSVDQPGQLFLVRPCAD